MMNRNKGGDWCVGHQAGQHELGIRREQGAANWIWVSGFEPPTLDEIANIRLYSIAGYLGETILRRLLIVRREWSKR